MGKAKDIEDARNVTVEIVSGDDQVEGKVEKAEGLSLRDALEVAMAGTKTTEELKTDEPTTKKVNAGETRELPKTSPLGEGGNNGAARADEQGRDKESRYDAPAEYTPEEKADFMQLSRKGQEAQLRLDRSRKAKIDDIRAASAEFEWSRDLAKELTPYLKSVGEKRPAHEALILALKMRNEFENGDPKKAAAEYLQAKKIKVPSELLEEDTSGISDAKIKPLQEKIDALSSRLAEEDRAKAITAVTESWQTFQNAKNAGGVARFPDINDSDTGLRLSADIASLVRGDTALSQQFIALARSRIPDLTYPRLLEEAYRYSGGRIDDSPASKTQSTQTHIAKSSRAAASVPGRGSTSVSSGSTKKFKTYREAAEAALAELREAEG